MYSRVKGERKFIFLHVNFFALFSFAYDQHDPTQFVRKQDGRLTLLWQEAEM